MSHHENKRHKCSHDADDHADDAAHTNAAHTNHTNAAHKVTAENENLTQLLVLPQQHSHSRRVMYVDTSTITPVIEMIIHETLVDTTSTDTTGLHLWPSSVLLGAELVDMGRQGLLRDLHVVELGAGTGLAGCVAGAREFGAASVHFTDNDPNVVASLRRNMLRRNFGRAEEEEEEEEEVEAASKGERLRSPVLSTSNTSSAPHVDVMQLAWGDVVDNENFDILCNTADLILGADCLYDRKLWESFFATVHCLLTAPRTAATSAPNHSRRPPRRFIGCHQLRNSNHTIQPLLQKWGLKAREMSGTKNIRATGIEQRGVLESTLGLFELTLRSE